MYSLEPPRRGGSNEYPQSMVLSRNKKNNVYPCKLQFYCIKMGLRESKLYRHVIVMQMTQDVYITRGVQRIVVFMVNKSKKISLMVKYGAWFEKRMEFLEIKSTSHYVSWHYLLMSSSAGCGEIMR